MRRLNKINSGLCRCLLCGPVTLPSDGEPQPDLAIVRPPESRYDDRHPDPDDIYWLIEVSNSTLAYDLGDKAGYYTKSDLATPEMV